MLRIGQSTDIHVLVEGRPLILGGVEIPHNKGLAGHSDADVLLHAIAESMLGALALGDLGKHFPDTDPKYKDVDSKFLLQEVHKLVIEAGYHIVNIDSLVLAQKPKLAPHILVMRETIAALLDIEMDQINVKATTGEKVGFVGREEGIMAQAVVLLEK
ncbi:2-C-methyl-D-erythritol 2,4-cyclodiphosphate synthase [Culicoidibacter larvae]|uniref:2-C-methyl-D-erythritol 2,4-cyclodiphosphate synthase n=1 Tax=Culicoidibacter larvae TaxID=2579976 RepID=A0A5R8QHE0_9FIRM|nr:2-C-methyl-D-erythritol 2,4-cyclodiphosphate synthase [Culicoidibacter larvae]TLG77156.1 2-C-methyl-D-erythritol 2,4-cyclodiphosphate synthase [Culicoidibacter larvae]